MMNDITINQKVESIRQIEARIDELERQLDSIKNELKSELNARKVDYVDTGLHKVFYSVYEKASVDTDKLKKEGLYDKFKKLSTVIQFKITDIKA